MEVPGARWFRADLHVHTLDDYPGNRLRWGGRSGQPIDDALLTEYARAVLKTAVARGVEVLGLTPHAVYCQGQETLSAIWRIVETWNDGLDDDDVPFRDKVYAVFPGFEPSLADGARGVHLLFLFDPEIGREGFVRAFHAVMNGVDPWSGGRLNNAGKDAKAALESIGDLCERDARRWNWLALAPHAFASDQGLFGQLKSQILQYFPHHLVAALELADNSLPEDHLRGRDWLEAGMTRYRHCFFHASDAYILNPDPASTALVELGSRTTVLKMAEPRVEALRQALLASESRLRLAYERDATSGDLIPASVPDPLALRRPWLRSVNVAGGTSFFGGQDDAGGARSTAFRLNPDLTCIIGGRMSGKSTLLDGLRVAFGFPLPSDEQVRADVESRARDRFLSGNPTVDTDVCGPVDPTCSFDERWPAVFFTQRELQQAVTDQEGLRQLLFQLLPGQGAQLQEQFQTIAALSRQLARLVPQLTKATEALGEAEQALAKSSASKEALERFRNIGASQLSTAQADLGRIRAVHGAATRTATALRTASQAAAAATLTSAQSDRIRDVLNNADVAKVQELLQATKAHISSATSALEEAKDPLDRLASTADSEISRYRGELESALVKAGGTAEELNQFAALSKNAELFEESRLAAEAAATTVDDLRTQFRRALEERDRIRIEHRAAMVDVAEAIERRFDGLIRALSTADGVDDALGDWIVSLKERGVTRWWNDAQRPIAPSEVLAALQNEQLDRLGMSEQVARTFTEVMTETQQYELQALHTPDRYLLQLQVAPGEYRAMNRLSGGQQVSLLLSLLLESDDTRPLVIDQPEDELDKSYLFDTVLPALHRLKGQRQVVLVTHDANIVVNGDADQVICLQADADTGWVAAQGAIEQPEIRQAILTVLDGGADAFELRSRKYGF